MTTNRPLKVFLCHSSADKPAVRELYQKLRAEPWIQPWLDEEELYPGQDWETEIEKAVEASDVVLVCLSNGSINKRGFVQKELRFALDVALEMPEETIFIVPLRLEECTPPRSLRDWQYADYFEGQHERGFQRLLVSLKRRADSLNLKTGDLLQKENKFNSSEMEVEYDTKDGGNSIPNTLSAVSNSSSSATLINDPSNLPWLDDAKLAVEYITRLTLESSAQATLIIRGNKLWAYAGGLSKNAAMELTQIINRGWDEQNGADLIRFIRLQSTNAEHMLYVTRLNLGTVLALVFDAETPLSKIRAQARQIVGTNLRKE